ncbi:hypothetical protein ATE84_3460 [Aquimarina sp. MAR_2010_214]|uniref:hypothetical protein n=1 Tax=Aquimarina sp. MAR_2010_214 TaxID=1250026 RepID=UPI000C702A21|nr:hypothetical protein [Aquimarina sp. MAR_2010_214]PKV51375.1 hypothetical protein ATE84_3460 [Aquimarina sp. MAR_2010_214]
MQKCFFLICPTDCLEHTINKTFKYENYFYTSLGNSFIYDSKTIAYIKQIIKKHNIKEIYFVLSMDNKIVLDALGNDEFSNIGALHNFYNEIRIQKERSKISFQRGNRQFRVFSYYLNEKIKELELQLANLSNQPIKIGGKIYNRDQGVFTTIYSDLVCLDKYHLN